MVVFVISPLSLQAQDLDPSLSTSAGWQRYDWLKPAEEQKTQASALGGTFSATQGQDMHDPFAVISNGTLWQGKYDAAYMRSLGDTLSLSCESSSVTVNDPTNPLATSVGDLSREQKMGLQFQPVSAITLRGNVHDSATVTSLPTDPTETTGTGFTVEGHLPLNSVITMGINRDRVGTDSVPNSTVNNTAYDAQFQQPLGKIPLTAVFKGHYDESTASNTVVSRTPSLEQSLVWKPVETSTLQMGLRQQQYQNFPGMSSDFNEAVFADWSQKVDGDFVWHSYAEVLDSRSNQDVAPEVATTTGTNGSPQSTAPGSQSVTGAMPLIAQDKTLTFTTGPSFKLQKDLSASIEYSNRWDQNPAPGAVGQEQRVSLSVKGSF